MTDHTNHNEALAELAALGHGNAHSTIDVELETNDDGTSTVTLYESIETPGEGGVLRVDRGAAVASGTGSYYVDALNDLLRKVK